MAVTLIGLFALLSVYGSGDLRANRTPAASPAASTIQSAAQDAGRAILSPPAADMPGADAATASDEPVASIDTVAQTPQQVQRFPGPPLRPSPEHAGATPPASTAPAGATGPVLYVTGSRVNFRAGPSTGDRVIGALDGGSAVEALGATDGAWVNIRDGNGRIGYISGQFLSADAPG